MKPSSVGAVAGFALVLSASSGAGAQVPAEDAWWWESEEAEEALATTEYDYADVGYDAGPPPGARGREGGWVERGPGEPGRGGDEEGGFRPSDGRWGGAASPWCRPGPPAVRGGGCGPTPARSVYGGGAAGQRPRWVGADWGRIGVGGRFGWADRRVLGARELERLLGPRTMTRLHRHALRMGVRGLPRGRLVDLGRRGVAIQVRVERTPIAELIDFDRDRRIDAVRLNDPWLDRAPARFRGAGRPSAVPARARGGLLDPRLVLRDARVEGGGVRYSFAVPNWDAFDADLFRPAPDLPACGLNRMSSRTWVDVFDGAGRRLYGFCGLASPQGLDGMWAFVPEGDPASEVYVVLTDRLTGESVASNLVALR